MWTKYFHDGSVISENQATGQTWMKTSLEGITEVSLRVKGPDGTMVERKLSNYSAFWHSRTSVANESYKPIIVAERIQALRDDGKWKTITWNGQKFVDSVEDRAIGKPVIK